MSFRKFWKIEYTMTLFAIFAIFILLIPTTIQSTRQASLISRWNEKYNHVSYMFSVLDRHSNEDIIKSLKKADTEEEKSRLMILLMQPYLRISSNSRPPRRYHPKYMSGIRVEVGEDFYFDDFYFAKDHSIVGIKDVEQLNSEGPMFMLMFDLNGLLPPNRWGKDIFGINIYSTGHIEPLGRQFDLAQLKTDCSENGLGINCSYYYIIGGSFNE